MVDPIKVSDALAQTQYFVSTHHYGGAASYLRDLHPADAAEVLSLLEPDEQAAIAPLFNPAQLADILEQLNEDEMVEVSEHLDTGQLADVLDAMEPDMAADLLGELDDDQAVSDLLEEMEDSHEVEPLLAYDEETAGGIMNYLPPCLRRWMTVEEALRFIKEQYAGEQELYYLYVLDRYGVLIGVVNLRMLILAEPQQTVEEIMNSDVISVTVDTDQEEVAHLLARYDLLAIPVADDRHRLVGIVAVDDVVDVLEDEATEDIYRLAQVSEEAEIFSPIHRAIRNRLPWLYINMGTALLSAAVVTYFAGTIAAAAVLAAFMPIVAAQGGNAGNQTMTIMVRSLALGEIELGDVWRALRHELTVDLLQGFILGISIGLLTYLWQGNAVLGIILGISMVLNLLIAATMGVVVPITLKRIGVDPALASGVFVTATTDVMGFAIFLGLATYFIAWLV
jgi:magnesium transporter